MNKENISRKKIGIILFAIFAVVFIAAFIKVCIDNSKENTKVDAPQTNQKVEKNKGDDKTDDNVADEEKSSRIKYDGNSVIYNVGHIMVNLGEDAVLSKEILDKTQYVNIKNNEIGLEQIKQGQMAVYATSEEKKDEEICKIDLNNDGKEEVVKHIVKNAVTDELRKVDFFKKDFYEHILMINDEEKLSVMSYFPETKITMFSLKDGNKDVIVIGMYVLDNGLSVMEAPYDYDNCENTILYIYEGNETKELNQITVGKISFDISLINSDDLNKKSTVVLKNGQIITFGSDNTYLNNGTEDEPKSLYVTYTYKLEKGELVEDSKNNIHYYKMKFDTKNKVWPMEIIENIEIYAKANVSSQKIVVKPQKAMPVSSIFDVNEIMPHEKWIYIITETGQKGWIYLEKRAKSVAGVKIDNTIYNESNGLIFSKTIFTNN